MTAVMDGRLSAVVETSAEDVSLAPRDASGGPPPRSPLFAPTPAVGNLASMAPPSSELPRRPQATTYSVEDLVNNVVRGRIRIPSFQRPLRWESQDVLDLFDSLYRGYPVGSLLLNKAPAPATRLQLGPLVIPAPELADALWVVDGQQRLTALAASLARAEPLPSAPLDPWIVYFDVRDHSFRAPRARTKVSDSWIPAPRLLDAAALSEWVHGWSLGKDPELRRALFEAGRRIREYAVPGYVVETDDDTLLRDVFDRINAHGKQLEWTDVHDALFGGSPSSPSSLGDLATELRSLGMGALPRQVLLHCIVAFHGEDVTRPFREHVTRRPELFQGGVKDVLPAVRWALAFLREHAAIPHVSLLPRTGPLVTLTRFFALHHQPNARTRTLLRRFVWRGELTVRTTGALDERTLRRRAIDAIRPGDEEASAQALLALVPAGEPGPVPVDAPFDPRSARTRTALLALAGLGPRHVDTGVPLDVARVLEEHGANAFPQVVEHRGAREIGCINRIVHPPVPGLEERLRVLCGEGNSLVLRSHAIPDHAAHALWTGDDRLFLSSRASALDESLRAFTGRLAEWGASDRPSLEYILQDRESQG